MPIKVLALAFYALTLPTLALAACQSAIRLSAHLEPGWNQSQVCTNAPTEVDCTSGSDLVLSGELNTTYTLYLLALEVHSPGIKQVGFGLSYDATPGSGVDIFGFASCADVSFPHNGWPASGGGIELSFNNCQGAEPDLGIATNDVPLGAVYVYAYSADVIEFISHAPEVERPYVRGCENEVTLVPSGNDGATAEIGFGGAGTWDPCIYDFGVYGTCCLETGCQSMPQSCCLTAGGHYIGFKTCDKCATPVDPSSWGAIKSRYE